MNTEDRMVRFGTNENLANHIESSVYMRLGTIKSEYRKIENLLEELSRETQMENGVMKPTIVLVFPYILGYYRLYGYDQKAFEILKGFHQKGNWDVILFRYDSNFEVINWLPLYRNIQTNIYRTNSGYSHSIVKDLIDVIKNPDFDRYNFEYRSLLSRKDYFPDGCLDEVKDIHIISDGHNFALDLYLPLIRAILRRENVRRENSDTKPLEVLLYNINFDSQWFSQWFNYLNIEVQVRPGANHLKFFV